MTRTWAMHYMPEVKAIKINFTDFWKGFNRQDNYFINLLKQSYTVEISDKPEILFYSTYGSEFEKYNCIRVFYSAENIRPDFVACDYAITFDFLNRKNHYRLPLYALYIDHQYYSGSKSPSLAALLNVKTTEEAIANWRQKSKFCAMVVSNGLSGKRISFFENLSKVKHVDSGGMVLNNVGGPVQDKLQFIKDHQFVIAFENSSYPGYVTEKIIEPFFTDCIPVYWGSEVIHEDFNPGRFLSYNSFATEEALIARMIEISENESEAVSILKEPIFPDNKVPEYIKKENVLQFLEMIVESSATKRPVAIRPYHKLLHRIKKKNRRLKSEIKATAGKYLRKIIK